MKQPKPEQTTDEFSKQTVNETLAMLETTAQVGLSQTEAKERLSLYGPNEIITKEATILDAFLDGSGGQYHG